MILMFLEAHASLVVTLSVTLSSVRDTVTHLQIPSIFPVGRSCCKWSKVGHMSSQVVTIHHNWSQIDTTCKKLTQVLIRHEKS